MTSPSGPAITLLLVVWGEGRDAAATFHLKTVEHRTAVYYIQHGTTGLQSGEDLEDKRHGTSGSEGQVMAGQWEELKGDAI